MEVSTANLSEIKIFPSTEFEEIAQNVLMIVTTIKGSVFLDRNFGINLILLDAPISIVQNKLTAQIVSAVKEFEPRASVTVVIYNGQKIDGNLNITVRFKIVENKLRGGV